MVAVIGCVGQIVGRGVGDRFETVETARHLCRLSRGRIDRRFRELPGNADSGGYRLAKAMLESCGRGETEEGPGKRSESRCRSLSVTVAVLYSTTSGIVIETFWSTIRKEQASKEGLPRGMRRTFEKAIGSLGMPKAFRSSTPLPLRSWTTATA